MGSFVVAASTFQKKLQNLECTGGDEILGDGITDIEELFDT